MRATVFGLFFIFRIISPILFVASLLLAPAAVFGTEPQGVIGGQSYAMAVSGQYAYVGEGLYLKVFDISDETRPREVGSIKLPHSPKAIAASGAYAYLACWNENFGWGDPQGEFVVVDLTNPRSPQQVSAQKRPYLRDIQIQGGWAYLANGGVVEVYDLANPRAPQYASKFPAPGYSVRHEKLTVAGTRAYAANAYTDPDPGLSIQIYDISNPRQVRYLGAAKRRTETYTYLSEVKAIAVNGSLLYSVDWSYLRILDATNPAAPTLLAEIPIQEEAEGDCYNAVAQCGECVCVARSAGLFIFNVHNPRQPSLACTIPSALSQAVIAPADRSQTVFLSDRFEGLKIYDVTTPASPQLKGYAPGIGNGPLIVDGPYAYLGDNNGGIRVVDASDPGSMSLAAIIPTPGKPRAMEKTGDLLYAAGDHDLELWDMTRPTSATLLGSLKNLHDARGELVDALYEQVQTHDQKVYLTGWRTNGDYGTWNDNQFFTIVDAHDPSAPRQLSYLAVSTTSSLAGMQFLSSAEDASARHDYVYLQTLGSGLQIIDVTNALKPEQVATFNPPDGLSSFKLFRRQGANYMMALSSLTYPPRIFIYSLTDPLHPRCIANQVLYYGSGVDPLPIVIAGDYAIIGSCQSVTVVSLAALNAPAEVDRIPMSVESMLTGFHVGIQGSTLYVHDSVWGLLTYRLKNIPEDNATIVGDTFPRRLYAGQFISGEVTVRNSGQSTWSQANPAFPAVRSIPSLVGALRGESLNASVTPGQEQPFAATLTAPLKPGEYALTLQMARPQASATPLSFFGEPYVIRISVSPTPSAARQWTEYR